MARSPWHEEADLIVVGASVGGLAAAIMAADRRCRVIVVEHAKELGGRAATEPEVIAAAGSRFQQVAGITDGPKRLVDDLQAASRHHVEPDLVAALAEQGAPLVAWLADRCGAQVELLTGETGEGHSVARLHAPGERGGASLVADLTRAATRHSHITVRTGAIIERLVREDGVVRGLAVRADRRGASHALAGSVLLAAGGFVANDELVTTHAPAVAGLPSSGPPLANGDGLRLGLEAGAQTRRLAACEVTPFLSMPAQLAVTAPLVDLGAMLVNQAGHRFADETGERLPLALTVRAQPGKMAYLLFDERIAGAASAMDPFFRHVVLPRAGRRGATLADLARQFELNVTGLSLTVDTFNATLDLGGDPFGRERFEGRLEAPFHAIRVTGTRLHTLGGLAVDAHARVLNTEGQPIEGLYATGGTAAGLAGEATEGVLAGTTTLAALGLGRLAALDVIARVAARADEA